MATVQIIHSVQRQPIADPAADDLEYRAKNNHGNKSNPSLVVTQYPLAVLPIPSCIDGFFVLFV